MPLQVPFHTTVSHLWQRLTPPPPGWVGVDIGTRTIKFAQVERRGGQYQIARRWLMTFGADQAVSPAALEAAFLAQKRADLTAVRKLFAAAPCAATLSMSFQDLRSFEIPAGPRPEMREMVREEFAAEEVDHQPEERTFDFWELGDGGQGTSRVTAIALSSQVATRVVQDLIAAGFDCQVLDGLPCALARAAAMVAPESERPVGILDLGHSAPTFVVAAQGRPLFTRVLRGGGMQSLMQPLLESLQLSDEQCTQLLVRYGVAGNESPLNSPARRMLQLLGSPLVRLVEEIERTLVFVSQQFRSLQPSQLWLLGGGALVRNLATYLRDSIQLPVHVWTLASGSEVDSADEALFGVAAALSALKWEQHPCM